MNKRVEFIGVEGIPEIKPGDDLAQVISEALRRQGLSLEANDVLAVSAKIVSKAEDRVRPLDEFPPSRRARVLGRITGKDPREVEMILRASKRVMGEIPVRFGYRLLGRADGGDGARAAGAGARATMLEGVTQELVDRVPSLLIVEMANGVVSTDAGIDGSNVKGGLCFLPADPDASARQLRDELEQAWGCPVAVVLSDTEIRPNRWGTADVAVGIAGIQPVRRQFGQPDRNGRPKFGGVDALADLVTAGANLIMGQTSWGTPVVVVRGLEYERSNEGSAAMAIPSEVIWGGITYNIWWLVQYAVRSLLGL